MFIVFSSIALRVKKLLGKSKMPSFKYQRESEGNPREQPSSTGSPRGYLQESLAGEYLETPYTVPLVFECTLQGHQIENSG